MDQRKIVRYQCRAYSAEEAQQMVVGLLLLDGCFDALADACCIVSAYFKMDAVTTQKMLPDGCRILPASGYYPGELGTLERWFPGACQHNQVTVLHLSYLRGHGYRYFVEDRMTQAQGWIDAQYLGKIGGNID